jgi:hypothetical protein
MRVFFFIYHLKKKYSITKKTQKTKNSITKKRKKKRKKKKKKKVHVYSFLKGLKQEAKRLEIKMMLW